MAKPINYETLVRNFSGYEEALLKATHASEIPLIHLSAAVTAVRDDAKCVVMVNSKTFAPYSGVPVGYNVTGSAMVKLNDFFVDAGKNDGWKVENIEISETDLGLLSFVSKLPLFDDYVQSRKETVNASVLQLMNAVAITPAPDGAVSVEETDREEVLKALKGIAEKNAVSTDFCCPKWCVGDELNMMPCFACPGVCDSATCPYKKFTVSRSAE